jgi:hypothetical protein
MILSTWFYSSPNGENFSYPSVGDKSSETDFQLCYFRCVIDFFASSYSKNREMIESNKIKHLFLCNSIPDFVSKIQFYEFMEIFKVEIIFFEPKRIPKFSVEKNLIFGSVFTQIDVIQRISELIEEDEYIYLMDNDVLINRDLLTIDYITNHNNPVILKQQSDALDQMIQGRPLRELIEITNYINQKNKKTAYHAYVHTGGELVAMNCKNLKIFSKYINEIYDANLECAELGLNYFETEEQIFSCAYTCFKELIYSNYIARIWTDKEKYRTVTGNEEGLHFLHIPSEKRSGFNSLFKIIQEKLNVNQLNDTELDDIFKYENIKEIFNL